MASGLTPEIVNALLEEGWTGNEIATEYQVSRQYVSRLRHQVRSPYKTPRQIAMESYPWKTGAEFNGSKTNRRMRDHFEYMATGGKGMTEDQLRRLAWFYRHLMNNDYVVEFDPNIPPTESDGPMRLDNFSDAAGGFAYRKRRPSDGDLIIRVNRYTTVTPHGDMLLRMPPNLPKV